MDTVPEGTASDRVYLIAMNEDFWKGLPAERQEFCKETWLKKVAPLPGVKWVALQLIPDELFPSGTHETPYIEWQQTITRDSDAPYTINAEVTVNVRTGIEFTPMYRAAIIRELGVKYGSGTRWVISQDGIVLETGKL